MATKYSKNSVGVGDDQEIGNGFQIRKYLGLASLAAFVIASLAILIIPLPSITLGIVVIVAVVAGILAGLPVAVSMVFIGTIGLFQLAGIAAVSSTLEGAVYGTAASWELSVIPLFVLMGVLLGETKIVARAFIAAREWMGGLPGGLAVGTNLAGAGLAAASGSTIGSAYALGRVAIPEMHKNGYRGSFAAAVVAVAGTLGQIIPPSILLVIYAGIAETPVGPQLVAGMLPGVVLALGYSGVVVVRSIIDPEIAPRISRKGVTWRSRFLSLKNVVPMVLIVGIVIGGLLSGALTPTEAGAAGVIAVLMMACFMPSSSGGNRVFGLFDVLVRSVKETLTVTASIFLLLIGVEVLTRVMALSRLAQTLSTEVVSLGLGPVTFLLVLLVVYVFLGMFLDPLAIIALTVPVLLPALMSMHIDLIWFGVFVIVLAEAGMVTPPVGILVFIVHKMTEEPTVLGKGTVKLTGLFKDVIWFVVVCLLMVVLMILYPEMVTYLPELSGS